MSFPLPILQSLLHCYMKYRLLVVVLIVIQIWGCSPGIHAFDWLNGTWEMPKTNGSVMLEMWEEKDRAMMSGKGLKLVGPDTTLLESIQLYADRKDVWYAPTVMNQNDGAPVAFKMISSTNHQFVFENSQHDFPQRIVYHLKPMDRKKGKMVSPGDTLDIAVTSLDGEGIHYRFTRKSLK